MKKMKKLLSLLLAVFLAVGCFPLGVSAADEVVNEAEPNDSFTQADPILYDQFMWGMIDPANEADIYKLQLKRGNWQLDIATDFPLTYSIYDKDGNQITSSPVITGDNTENWAASYIHYSYSAKETYYIKVEGAFGDTGEYCLYAYDYETPFTDIGGHWGRESIEWCYLTELFSGVSSSEFGPNQNMNRSMFAAVLWRLSGRPEPLTAAPFTDLKKDAYYQSAVAWAAENKVISGKGEGLFCPDDSITRQEIAAMLYRYAKLDGHLTADGDLSKFPDADKVSGFAKEAMQWAVGEGIISGKDNEKLDPTGFATRAEVASILRRFA